MARSVIALLVAVALAGAAMAADATAQEFMPGSEDVPLMQGLTVLPDRGHVFDTPSGRLVESYAAGPVSRAEVLAFYRDTLPALGWEPDGGGVFRREDETLAIVFEEADGDLIVRFNLAPRQ